MPEVQVGTKQLPIRIIPRINGVPVTQTDIKNNHTNRTSPVLSFTLEYKTREGTTQIQLFDAGKSTDSMIFFDMPDSFYANEIIYTLLPFWTVSGGGGPDEVIYADESIMLEVKDLHDGI